RINSWLDGHLSDCLHQIRLNVSTFNDIKPLFDSTTGIKIDVAHLMASLNALLFGASLLRPLASRI
ncbi:hypothetical protein DQM24_12450, partial [Lacticaseibacillus paracasei]